MNNENISVVDLFAGAGGWDVAAAALGWDVDRVEIWEPANLTAEKAGYRTVHEDVTTFHAAPGQYDVQIASPPCQTYSMAGKGEGRANLDRVLNAIHGHDISDLDARTGMVLEPLRIALECRPTYIAWEQVIAVLPIWEACADVLREQGYSVSTGVLNAEQYGVPQTRRRAVLMARRDGKEAALPTPTHSRFHSRDLKRLDAGVLPWVSMAQALGWTEPVEAVSNYGTGGDPKNRGVRHGDESFSTVPSKSDRVVLHAVKSMGAGMVERHGARPGRGVDQPAFTIRASAGGTEPGGFRWALRSGNQAHASSNQTWVHARPATPVMGDPRIMKPGRKERGPGGEASMSGAIKVTAEQAACLQTFPAGHPFQGNKGQVFQQIGNAVPPLLAHAILSTLTA